ncbi:MAG: hypothetical protein ACKO9I_03420 [Sphaerospermopsis kisseleviana]
MSIWIVTTGNSDVILTHNQTWGDLHYEASDKLECSDFAQADPRDSNDHNAGYTVPARVLGIVYENQKEYYEQDLKFPLLDTYQKYLTANNVTIERIIVLLTDQSQIFSTQEQRIHPRSPYWKDTCTLKPVLEWYFQNSEISCTPEFEYFIPSNNAAGIDNWDATLSLVETKLTQLITELNIDTNQEVYVSHQAGTPAVSSAVQFVSIGKFKKVKFLVANEYFDPEDYDIKSQSKIIESSRYQRSVQIQKAKQLIESGLPGAALNILDTIDVDENLKQDLRNLVRFFNIESELAKSGKFDSGLAIERVINALELVSCYFQEQSYIQGITLLSAAHETFLKAAIMKELSKKYSYFNLSINGNTKRLQVIKVIEWTKAGLSFAKDPKDNEVWELDNHLKRLLGINIKNIKSYKLDILQQLSFPTDNLELSRKLNKVEHGDFKIIGSNTGMLAWLKQLSSDFASWKLMEFIGRYDREFEEDRRNQLMHNLVGAKPKEVIKYLMGNQNSPQYTDNHASVVNAYEEEVKKPFLKQINKLGLPYKESDLRKQLQEIASKLS